MPGAILALNAGSSSIKFGLFEVGDGPELRLMSKGGIQGVGGNPHFTATDAAGASMTDKHWQGKEAEYDAMLGALLAWAESHVHPDTLVAVGHRVVHGGRDFTAPVRLTAEIVQQLDALTPLAPLHQPHSLAPIRTLTALRPGLPQVACFDTAFHNTMPAVAKRFALPREYEDEGVWRYGFHGLSYEYVSRALRQDAPGLSAGRVVVAHLGNGASLCAMRDGQSQDTTMGFTALDGLVMGTRCGTLDAGVVLYMLQQKGLDAHAVEQVLYERSGLLGVSGLSSDMRTLLDSADERAREAVELFAFRVGQETAAMAASMNGLDGFVFTGGIGEHAVAARTLVCERLRWLGVALDAAANANGAGRISTPGSRVEVHVIPTDEEATIARHTHDLIA
ncbi:acetate/propionate family kinase (plasmid) [Lichenicola cladoniae]|uniref:Acetate kinase n=1 Tax=Lichenicola cladoniae TaxID=1484109 RepID=A0A6M8HYR3_9PROT|nr:acetate/propionate family kinase [Lichenicola cladoniae]NPD70299.1 acetate/propionate family kinase [Acetobacteraceae bacterium]QKE93542.1 acetate/propionate family kinase [Lichenicola cladoniae]